MRHRLFAYFRPAFLIFLPVTLMPTTDQFFAAPSTPDEGVKTNIP
jgi:hypothetical protein